MRSVLLRKSYGSCFAGETAGYPDDIAEKLIADEAAYPLDKNGNPIIPTEDGEAVKPKRGRKPASKAEGSADDPPQEGVTVDADDDEQLKFNPFVVDGLDAKVVDALTKAQILTPDDVKQYLADGKLLTDLDGIGDAYAQQLLQLYSA